MRAKHNHGMSKTRAHSIWRGMHVRCYVKHRAAYKDYGGRGIIVCKRWHSFVNFISDMGHPEKGMTIDRKDNDGPYSPENCRWATRKQQAMNSRNVRSITFRGETHNLTEWAGKLNKSLQVISSRLNKGWSVDEAFTTPCRPFINYPSQTPEAHRARRKIRQARRTGTSGK